VTALNVTNGHNCDRHNAVLGTYDFEFRLVCVGRKYIVDDKPKKAHVKHQKHGFRVLRKLAPRLETVAKKMLH
jgi:hypothetical protein